MYNNFINDCLYEGTLLSEIDDYVEYWHTHDVGKELDEFLGFTEFENEQWLLEGNRVIRDILYCRRHEIAYEEYVTMPTEKKIAARSYNLKEVRKYKEDEE